MISGTAVLPARPSSAVIWGRVLATDGVTIRVGGIAQLARIGDQLRIRGERGEIEAEIVAIERNAVTAMLMSDAASLAIGQRACLVPLAMPCPANSWLGHVVDAYGRVRGTAHPPPLLPARAGPATAGREALRRGLGPPISTGVAAFDTLLPLCRGQRMGIFAGSGVGKSRLLADLARGMEADVTVVALIGERRREVGSLAEELFSLPGGERCVIIASTSDEPALAKRRGALLALATAEHHREQGRHVLLLFDSVTRFAEAHREIGLAAGQPPAMRGYPPSTAQSIAELCERAGPGCVGDTGGDISAVFTVLVAGSDMDEPVADMLRGVLDGHVILDRQIAERGRFPAIDLRRSVSRSAEEAWTPEQAALCAQARQVIATYEESATLIRSGLYTPGADPAVDRSIRLYPALDTFLARVVPGRDREDAFAELAAIFAGEGMSGPVGPATKPGPGQEQRGDTRPTPKGAT